MAKPYSMDLRERVVASVERGGLSRNEAARRFGVGISTVIHWVRRFRETGSVAPAQIGGYKPKAIRGEHQVRLAERVQRGDFTLRGLVASLTTSLNASYDDPIDRSRSPRSRVRVGQTIEL